MLHVETGDERNNSKVGAFTINMLRNIAETKSACIADEWRNDQ